METTINTNNDATSSYLNADNVNTTKPSITITTTITTSTWPEANCHNAPTNVIMTLADARTELESRGFIILDQHQDDLQEEAMSSSLSLALSSNLLVGLRSECCWYKLDKMDTLVFVQELVGQDDPLTVDRIKQDLVKLKMDWLVSLPPSFYSPMGCPPHRWGRDRTILMVYLTKQQPIAEDVVLHLTLGPPRRDYGQLIFLAAQDGTNGASYYYSQKGGTLSTPSSSFLGREGLGTLVYGQVRYLAGLLTGRRPWWVKPSQNKLFWITIHLLFWSNILFVYSNHFDDSDQLLRFIGIIIGILIVVSLCLNAYYYSQRQQQQQQRHVWATSNSAV